MPPLADLTTVDPALVLLSWKKLAQKKCKGNEKRRKPLVS
jgi:hypothetical protein